MRSFCSLRRARKSAALPRAMKFLSLVRQTSQLAEVTVIVISDVVSWVDSGSCVGRHGQPAVSTRRVPLSARFELVISDGRRSLVVLDELLPLTDVFCFSGLISCFFSRDID